MSSVEKSNALEAGLVTESRPCGSNDLRLTDRLDRARWHRLQHFGSAAYSLGTAMWFRLKRDRAETGSVRAHRQPDGTVEHMSGGHAACGMSAGLALGFVTQPEANWSRSSFCSVTSQFRQ